MNASPAPGIWDGLMRIPWMSWLEVALYLVLLVLLTLPLGRYMAAVYEDRRNWFTRLLGPLEGGIYRLAGVDARREMGWKQYAIALMAFNLLGLLATYLLQRLQGWLPLNPEGLSAVSADSSFNTATSFATNTNWQGYSGEVTLS
jgi:K+-transporting ATPase ATPase A chain